METYTFRVRVHNALDDEAADKLYEAFDQEIGIEEGPLGHFVEFERDAPSFLDAALDALQELSRLGFESLAVEDELVSMADVAERTGRSRQSISMLVSGERGPGDFPPPVAGNVRSPLWHWADVSLWFDAQAGGDASSEDRGEIIASINGALANRVLGREVVRKIQRRIAG